MAPQSSHYFTLPYRSDIDGLRAIAVVLAVGFHAAPSLLPGGFVGVDVFFVISGYLISTILFQNLARGSFSFAEFYARRVRRIFPALLLVLVSCYAFGWWALFADEYGLLGKHIAAGAGFVSNWVYLGEAGYFDPSGETKPLLHLWSLGIEEQFYIVWPLVAWGVWRFGLNLFTGLALLISASFYWNITGISADPVATFYSPLTRMWELLCGALLAWFMVYRKEAHTGVLHRMNVVMARVIYRDGMPAPHNLLANVVAWLGASLLAYSVWRLDSSMPFPGAWAGLPVLGTVMMIAAGPDARLNRTVLSCRLAVWFGLISYPLYLWHWPLLSFAWIVAGELPSCEVRIAAVALAVGLAWLTYRFVERPLRSGGSGRAKVAVLAVALGLLGVVGYATYLQDGLPQREVAQTNLAVQSQMPMAGSPYIRNELCERKYPMPGAEDYLWWFCMTNSAAPPTVLLLGNSFVNHFYPGLVFNEHLQHHSVLSIGACDPGWIEEPQKNDLVPTHPCAGARQLAQQNFINELISREGSIRYAIVGGLTKHAITQVYIDRIKRRIDFLESQGIRVIVFMSHVRPEYDIKSCYARPFAAPRNDCVVPVAAYQAVQDNLASLVAQLQQTNPNVLFFDPNIVFCDAQQCRFKLPELPAFRDQYGHLSEFASRLVFERFVEWARIHVPDMLASERNPPPTHLSPQ